MMRLTKVELRRLFSRRFTEITFLGAVIIAALMLIGSFLQSTPVSAEEQAATQAIFEEQQKDWQVNGARYVQDCRDMQKTDPTNGVDCDQMTAPRLEELGRPLATFSGLSSEVLLVGGLLLAFVGLVVGAGFVAAEFSTGSIGLWLTFEPRRMRVYASKLAAVCLGLIPVTIAILGLLTAGTWLIVQHFDSTAVTTAAQWGDLGWMAARSVGLAVAAAAVGAASGALLRHTAAVLGVVIGYLVLVESIFGSLVQASRPWLLQLNITAWLQHGAMYTVEKCATDKEGMYSCTGVGTVLSFGHSAAYLGALALFIIGLAALVFRRRDVS